MFNKEKFLALCKEWSKNTLMETLEIEYIDAGEDFLKAKMHDSIDQSFFSEVYKLLMSEIFRHHVNFHKYVDILGGGIRDVI